MMDEFTDRWENGKLSALWGHLLAKDCALMESSPPLLVAHIVRVSKDGVAENQIESRSGHELDLWVAPATLQSAKRLPRSGAETGLQVKGE